MADSYLWLGSVDGARAFVDSDLENANGTGQYVLNPNGSVTFNPSLNGAPLFIKSNGSNSFSLPNTDLIRTNFTHGSGSRTDLYVRVTNKIRFECPSFNNRARIFLNGGYTVGAVVFTGDITMEGIVEFSNQTATTADVSITLNTTSTDAQSETISTSGSIDTTDITYAVNNNAVTPNDPNIDEVYMEGTGYETALGGGCLCHTVDFNNLLSLSL